MKIPFTIKSALALCVVVGFFAVLILLGLALVKFEEGNQSALVLVGSLASAFGQVISWYYGSSESSEKKDEVLMKERERG